MCRRVTVLVLCVCVSVCYHSSGNVTCFYAQNEVQYVGGYLRLFLVFYSCFLPFQSYSVGKANLQMSIYMHIVVGSVCRLRCIYILYMYMYVYTCGTYQHMTVYVYIIL